MKDRLLTIIAYSFPLMFLLIILYINYQAFNAWKTTNYFINNGEAATGIVLKKEDSYSKGGTNYHLTYSYQPAGNSSTFTNRLEVDYNTHLLHHEGKQIKILYDPKRSYSSQIKGNDAYSMQLFEAALLDLILLILSITFLFKYYKNKRQSTT